MSTDLNTPTQQRSIAICGIALARAYQRGKEEGGEAQRVAALGIALMAALLVQRFVLACLMFWVDFRFQVWDLAKGR